MASNYFHTVENVDVIQLGATLHLLPVVDPDGGMVIVMLSESRDDKVDGAMELPVTADKITDVCVGFPDVTLE